MQNKFANKNTDDSNALTTDDREVMRQKNISPADVKDAINDKKVGETVASGARLPETGPKLIFSALLVISGILIAAVTSVSVIGIIIGLAFVVAGIILPFSNFRLGAGRRDTV